MRSSLGTVWDRIEPLKHFTRVLFPFAIGCRVNYESGATPKAPRHFRAIRSPSRIDSRRWDGWGSFPGLNLLSRATVSRSVPGSRLGDGNGPSRGKLTRNALPVEVEPKEPVVAFGETSARVPPSGRPRIQSVT